MTEGLRVPFLLWLLGPRAFPCTSVAPRSRPAAWSVPTAWGLGPMANVHPTPRVRGLAGTRLLGLDTGAWTVTVPCARGLAGGSAFETIQPALAVLRQGPGGSVSFVRSILVPSGLMTQHTSCGS